MRTRVKICGITRVEDGARRRARRRRCDRAGVLSRRARAASVRAGARHRRALPPFVSVVGLFVDPTADAVRAALAEVAARPAAVPRRRAPAVLRAFGRPYIKAVPVRPGVDLLQYAGRYPLRGRGCSMPSSLADCPAAPGRRSTGSRFRADLPRPLILSGGLNAQNVGAAIRRVHPGRSTCPAASRSPATTGSRIKGIKARRKSPRSSARCAMQMGDIAVRAARRRRPFRPLRRRVRRRDADPRARRADARVRALPRRSGVSAPSSHTSSSTTSAGRAPSITRSAGPSSWAARRSTSSART